MGELLWGLRGGAGRWHSGIFGNTWEQELHWIFKDRKSSISITFIFCGGNRAPSGIHFCWCKGRQLIAITKRPIAQLGLDSGYIHLLLDQIKLNAKTKQCFLCKYCHFLLRCSLAEPPGTRQGSFLYMSDSPPVFRPSLSFYHVFLEI